MFIPLYDVLKVIAAKVDKTKAPKLERVKHHVLKQLGLKRKDVPTNPKKQKSDAPFLVQDRGVVKIKK
jgi:hypothetical protein